jgi:hypothetical protein
VAVSDSAVRHVESSSFHDGDGGVVDGAGGGPLAVGGGGGAPVGTVARVPGLQEHHARVAERAPGTPLPCAGGRRAAPARTAAPLARSAAPRRPRTCCRRLRMFLKHLYDKSNILTYI